jgi:hypothetical protein
MSEAAIITNAFLLQVLDTTTSSAVTSFWTDALRLILPFVGGGLFGSILTIIYNRYRGKIQIMECHYIDDDVISRLPITNQGEPHQNIFSKQFLIINTTNTDHKTFRVIFQFDVTAKILRHTDITKSGIDRLKKKLLKPNEYAVTIRNFNRGDDVKFNFEIANITDDLINVTEDECIGFKVIVKDRRNPTLKSKLTLVEKARLNPIN